MFALKNKRGYFGGMVYHGECGWHCGFGGEIQDEETIYYGSLEQAQQQVLFMKEMFHEKNIQIVDAMKTIWEDKEVIV